MAEITVNDIRITYDGKTLTLSGGGEDEKSVSVPADSVPPIVAFVQSFLPEESQNSDDSDSGSHDESRNRREAFRVPVIADSGLRLQLKSGAKRFSGIGTNISMTGLYVEVSEANASGFELGDQLSTEMTLGKWNIELESIIRRKDADGLGLFFPDCIKGEHVDPPPVVRRIVMDLQRRWMQHLKES